MRMQRCCLFENKIRSFFEEQFELVAIAIRLVVVIDFLDEHLMKVRRYEKSRRVKR